MPSATRGLLEATLEALRNAEAKGYTGVTLRTESYKLAKYILRYLPRWRENGYQTLEGTAVVHAELLREIDQLMTRTGVSSDGPRLITRIIKRSSLGYVHARRQQARGCGESAGSCSGWCRAVCASRGSHLAGRYAHTSRVLIDNSRCVALPATRKLTLYGLPIRCTASFRPAGTQAEGACTGLLRRAIRSPPRRVRRLPGVPHTSRRVLLLWLQDLRQRSRRLELRQRRA